MLHKSFSTQKQKQQVESCIREGTQNTNSIIKVGRDEEITFVVSFINDLELYVANMKTNVLIWHLEVGSEVTEHTFEAYVLSDDSFKVLGC